MKMTLINRQPGYGIAEHPNNLNYYAQFDLTNATHSFEFSISDTEINRIMIQWKAHFSLNGVLMVTFNTENVYELTDIDKTKLKEESLFILSKTITSINDCICTYISTFGFIRALFIAEITNEITEQQQQKMEEHLSKMLCELSTPN